MPTINCIRIEYVPLFDGVACKLSSYDQQQSCAKSIKFRIDTTPLETRALQYITLLSLVTYMGVRVSHLFTLPINKGFDIIGDVLIMMIFVVPYALGATLRRRKRKIIGELEELNRLCMNKEVDELIHMMKLQYSGSQVKQALVMSGRL